MSRPTRRQLLGAASLAIVGLAGCGGGSEGGGNGGGGGGGQTQTTTTLGSGSGGGGGQTETPTETTTEPETTETETDTTETDTTETTTSTETETETATESGSSGASGIQVKVDYDGPWTGNIGSMASSKSVDGSGSETFDISDIDENFDVVTAIFQKNDDSSDTLVGQILDDGEVVQEQSTDAEYGTVSLSYNVGGM